ncbi:hypothetical protein HXX76_015575 [Chlamydomonas incerta]|uniref:J domain-containing protein n=1 Tax=Chlamydomonas incerta TaxID=51695 RepID=A0A835VRQ0_CHLIN|nr:hypothetical protein HXX76_015575 [Chlamydomonas incerta]|eukprot:KAG2423059.1 hypothetical protein HXX76_015575 [Chlamydomonas incerta]
MKLTRAESFAELGLQSGAGEEEVRAAYKRLALQWHPDKQPAEAAQAATARFQRISAGYAVLSRPVG